MYRQVIINEMQKLKEEYHLIRKFDVEEIAQGYSITVSTIDKDIEYKIFNHSLERSLNASAVLRSAFNKNVYEAIAKR